MRATRAMIGSLGAGVTLAIASSVALLFVSSVVAFNGWPGAPAEPPVDNVAKLTDSGTVAPKAGSHAIAASTLQLPATPAVRAHRAVAGAHRSATSSATKTSAAQASTTPAQAPAAPTTSGASPAAPHESAVHHVISQTGQHTADAVKQTTDAAAKVVAPVAPPAASTLEQLGAAGGSTVQQVTTTAAKVLGG